MKYAYAIMLKTAAIQAMQSNAPTYPPKVYASRQEALKDFCATHTYDAETAYVCVTVKFEVFAPALKDGDIPLTTFRIMKADDSITLGDYLAAVFPPVELGKVTATESEIAALNAILTSQKKYDMVTIVKFSVEMYVLLPTEFYTKTKREKYFLLLEYVEKKAFTAKLREKPEIACHFLNTIVNDYEMDRSERIRAADKIFKRDTLFPSRSHSAPPSTCVTPGDSTASVTPILSPFNSPDDSPASVTPTLSPR